MPFDYVEPFPWRHCPLCGEVLVVESDGEGPRPYCRSCRRFFYHNPTPAVCCILEHDGRLLLGKRNIPPQQGHWCFPGGFMELGETSDEAAARELYEETGLIAKQVTLIGVSTKRSSRHGSVVIIGYAVNEWEGEPIGGTDMEEVAFFKPDDCPEIAFDSHRELLAWFRERQS